MCIYTNFIFFQKTKHDYAQINDAGREHGQIRAFNNRTFDVSKPWLNRVLEGGEKQFLKAVDGVSFDVHAGEIFAFLGPNGWAFFGHQLDFGAFERRAVADLLFLPGGKRVMSVATDSAAVICDAVPVSASGTATCVDGAIDI